MTIVHHHDSFISQSGKTVYGKLSFFSLFSLFVQQPSLQPSTSDFLGAHYISQHAVLCQPDSTSPQKHMFITVWKAAREIKVSIVDRLDCRSMYFLFFLPQNGNTALHEAAWNGYSKCVTLLVNAKCNVNLHNRVR